MIVLYFNGLEQGFYPLLIQAGNLDLIFAHREAGVDLFLYGLQTQRPEVHPFYPKDRNVIYEYIDPVEFKPGICCFNTKMDTCLGGGQRQALRDGSELLQRKFPFTHLLPTNYFSTNSSHHPEPPPGPPPVRDPPCCA